MATLHMVVESVRGAQSKMLQEKETMLSSLTSLASNINQVVNSDWVGNSANEFQGQFESLQKQIVQQLDQLETLATQLQNEITQWEDMASRMG